MPSASYKIISPLCGLPPRSEAEAFGLTIGVWMQAANHGRLSLQSLNQLVLPALSRGQYALLIEEVDGAARAVAYLSWANLSAAAEARYLQNPNLGLLPEDWSNGDRTWFIDFVAPLGHSQKLCSHLAPLLAGISARYIYHRSDVRGTRVLIVTGGNVAKADANRWWKERPMLVPMELTSGSVSTGAMQFEGNHE